MQPSQINQFSLIELFASDRLKQKPRDLDTINYKQKGSGKNKLKIRTLIKIKVKRLRNLREPKSRILAIHLVARTWLFLSSRKNRACLSSACTIISLRHNRSGSSIIIVGYKQRRL